ncbi:MAG: hypothetical protein U0X41_10315 [Chitinophagales bacterium]
MLTYQQRNHIISEDDCLRVGEAYARSNPKIYIIIDDLNNNGNSFIQHILGSFNLKFSEDETAILVNTIYPFKALSDPDIVKVLQNRKYYNESLQPDFCIHFMADNLNNAPIAEIPNYFSEAINVVKYNNETFMLITSHKHKFIDHGFQYIQVSISAQNREKLYITHHLEALLSQQTLTL